jgi:cell division transport system permease protein
MPELRPRGADDLGLRQALSDRLLPLLVAAMVFLAALALAGAIAAGGLARHWRGGAGSVVTVQVPQPDEKLPSQHISRADAVAAALAALPGVTSRRLGAAELAGLLRPWLGEDTVVPAFALPAVFELRGADPAAGLQARLDQVASGTLVERNAVWIDRMTLLADSVQASAGLALLTVAFVAAAVTAVATRAGLGLRRDAIEIVHGLGATDGMIAGRFAARVTRLALLGALLGLALAVPLLLGLAALTAPFQGQPAASMATASVLPATLPAQLPAALWAALPGLPLAAAAIGWLTAQATVRSWLARLP